MMMLFCWLARNCCMCLVCECLLYDLFISKSCGVGTPRGEGCARLNPRAIVREVKRGAEHDPPRHGDCVVVTIATDM